LDISGGIAWAGPNTTPTLIFNFFLNSSNTKSVWIFILSFYTTIYGPYGTDGMMHMAEKVHDAFRQAPSFMIQSTTFAIVTSFLAAILTM
jgi:choline transport protein